MKEFTTILLINTLRGITQYLQDAPVIDAARPGVVELVGVLHAEMDRLQQRR